MGPVSEKHLGEPGLRIDAIELGGLDPRVELRSAMAARVRAGEGPVAAAHRDGADRPFGSLVRQADAPIVEEAADLAGLASEDQNEHDGQDQESREAGEEHDLVDPGLLAGSAIPDKRFRHLGRR